MIYAVERARRFQADRLAIAQLEFILVLVVLVPLFLVLLWLGYAGSRLVSVVSDARHQAWRERQNAKSNPFEFENSLQGRIAQNREETITFISSFDSWSKPTATHIVYAGNWGYPEIDLNKEFPNYKYMSQLAMKAPADRAANISELISSIRDFFKIDLNRLSELAIQKASSIQENILDKLNSFLDSVESKARDISEAIQDAKDQAVKRIEEIKEKLVTANTHLSNAEKLKDKIGDIAISKLQIDKLNPDTLKDDKKLEELFGDSEEGKKLVRIAKQLSDNDIKELNELKKYGDNIDSVINTIQKAQERLNANLEAAERIIKS